MLFSQGDFEIQLFFLIFLIFLGAKRNLLVLI